MIVLKIWLAAFDLATLGLVLLLLRETQRPLGLCISYAWCPLVLKEFSNSGHLDAIAVTLTTLAIWLAVRSAANLPPQIGPDSRRRQTYLFRGGLPAVAAGGALALAVGAKLYPVWLFPWLAALVLRRLGWRWCLATTAVFLATVTFVLWPLLASVSQWASLANRRKDAAAAETAAISGAKPDPSRGLKTFLMRWEMNDFLFMIAMENLMPAEVQRAAADPGFRWFPSRRARR